MDVLTPVKPREIQAQQKRGRPSLPYLNNVKDSISYRGSFLWNFGNYNDKEAAASPNFNNLKKRFSTENYFKDVKFDCMSASTTCYKQWNFVFY